MPYKKKYIRKRPRKSYRRRKGSGKFAKKMQSSTFTYVKKKYTLVEPITIVAGSAQASITVSHIGGKNAATPAAMITVADANPDNMAAADMRLYQFFKITGVAIKLFFPEGTTPAATPVQWSLAYSGQDVIKPDLAFGPTQTMPSFQTSSCSAKTPIKRYFKTDRILKRFGINWCSTDDYALFNNVPPAPLYNGGLQSDQGSSTNIKIYRSNSVAGMATAEQIARLQVTYYV